MAVRPCWFLIFHFQRKILPPSNMEYLLLVCLQKKNLLFFLFKIEGFLDWSDLAFTIHLAQDEKIEDNEGYLAFNLVLVESSTSIIKALRMVTVSPTFRSVIAKAVEQQNKEPFNVIEYYKSIKMIYDTYPEVVLMLKNALIVEQGGRTFKDD